MTTKQTTLEERFSEQFPEGKRREYDSFPFPLEKGEREALFAFIREETTYAVAKDRAERIIKETCSRGNFPCAGGHQ